jgi:septum formation protein
MGIILASTSARRREILALLGISFEVIAPAFDERVSAHLAIEEEVLDFALGKARSVARRHPQSIVIGSDTMISVEGQKIGKPADISDATRILRELAGKVHRIHTSVAIIDGSGGPGLEVVEQVSVRMRPYLDEDIEDYLACGESFDKAGAYSIQGEGRGLIDSIEGDFLAAVGLPLKPIAGYLASREICLPVDVERLYAEKRYLNWREFP